MLESNNLPEEDKCVNCKSFTCKIPTDILIKNQISSTTEIKKKGRKKKRSTEKDWGKNKLIDEKCLNVVPESFAEVGLHTTTLHLLIFGLQIAFRM